MQLQGHCIFLHNGGRVPNGESAKEDVMGIEHIIWEFSHAPLHEEMHGRDESTVLTLGNVRLKDTVIFVVIIVSFQR